MIYPKQPGFFGIAPGGRTNQPRWIGLRGGSALATLQQPNINPLGPGAGMTAFKRDKKPGKFWGGIFLF